MSVASMSAGDPPPYWNYNMPYPTPGSLQQIDFSAVEMADIKKRLEQLEGILLKLSHEQKVRDDNPFVRELYDQYKMGLALLEDPDD